MDILKSQKLFFDPLINEKKELPDCNGIYVLCSRDLSYLPKSMSSLDYEYYENYPVVYVGISGKQGLRKRYNNHFRGTARNSTIRKSIGALLGCSREYYRDGKYKFQKTDEEKISYLMNSNFVFFYWCLKSFSKKEMDEMEMKMIEYFHPPLNLFKNNSPINRDFRSKLKILRDRKQ
ncbi:MAG: hypothetical protein GX918_10550 [Clostridiales bacterium]|nr:hypothetical protein [Clostridiales bacterium]